MTDKNPEDVKQDAEGAAGKQEDGPPTVVLRGEDVPAAGTADRKVAWDEADEIPVGGPRAGDAGAGSSTGTAGTAALSFDTESLGTTGSETEEEIPVVVAAGPEAETLMGDELSTATSLLGATEPAENIGLLEQNPGFTETAAATATMVGEGATDVALDDITEDLGEPADEAAVETMPAAPAQRRGSVVRVASERSGSRAWTFAGVTALAAAIIAAVLLWPQWGPYVTGGISDAIAYGALKERPKVATTPASTPDAAAPAAAPDASTAAVASAASPSGAAAVVEAGYRGSWDTVIALSLGMDPVERASGDPSTK